MAEAIANHRFGGRLRAHSAGSAPRGAPHPMALKLLRRRGVPVEGLRSKDIEEFRGRPFDLVVTLCDSAARHPCPTFGGGPPTAHWSLPDPPAAGDPAPVFEAVFDALAEAIATLAGGDGGDGDLKGRAARAAAGIARRFG